MNHSLPSNWQRTKLKEICDICRGGSPRPIQKYLTTKEDGLNWLKIGDIDPSGDYIIQTSSKIDPSGLKKTTQVYPGDFILSNSMSFGRPYIMKITACIHDGWLALRNINNESSDSKYLYYLLRSPQAQQKFKSIAAGSGVLNLKKETVMEVDFLFPPLLEQNRIVRVLEIWDKAIKKLERKIELKKNAKKGLMQQLLTGKKRLPGFSGEWEMNALGSFIEFQSGYGFPLSVQGKENEKYPFLKVSDMNLAGNGIYIRSWNNTVSDEDLAALKAKSFPVNSIIFPKIGAAIATNKKRILSVPSLVDNNVMVAIAKENLDYQFFFQWLLTFDLSEWANSGGVPSMRKSTIENYIVNFPKLEEQIAIAKILTSSEQEIERQQSKLQKLKAQKTYLLNHLITGRIRTPESMSLSS